MKAAVLFELKKPLRLVELNVPYLKKGQVEVELIYSGICHSQVMEINGGRGEDKYLPHMLGHEGVGVVRNIGEGITKVAPGDKVVLGWIRGRGMDAPGGLYELDGQTINSGAVTTFAEKTIVAENRLVKLPPEIPARLGMLFGCALPTGAGLVFNELKPEPNKSIAIFGLGGIGMSALLACQTVSPRVLIAVDVNIDKLQMAKECGATHTINANEDVLNKINEIVPGGVDYSLDAGGRTQTIELAFESVRDGGGECVFASHPPNDEKIQLEPHAFHRGKKIRGSWGGGSCPDRDIPKLASLYRNGKLPLEKLISKEYSLDNINDAIADLENGRVVRALIKIAADMDS